MENEIIQVTRELGKLIQRDERYIRYMEAQKKNDADEDLQKAIGEFNLKKLALNEEIAKEEKDNEKIAKIDKEIRDLYEQIMSTEAMKEYSAASEDYKKLTNQVEMILAYSMQGEDPDAIDLEATCTGSCATCGGCH